METNNFKIKRIEDLNIHNNEKLDLKISKTQERKKLLNDINFFLREQKFPEIKKLGLSEEGEIEIKGINSIIQGYNNSFYNINFQICQPYTTKHNSYFIRYVKKPGTIFLFDINDEFFLINYQFRMPIGRWVNEFPRCFGKLSKDYKVGDYILDEKEIYYKEYKRLRELIPQLDLTSILVLDKAFENTGDSNAEIYTILVKIKIKDFNEDLRQFVMNETYNSPEKLKIYPIAQCYDMMSNNKLPNVFCKTALLKYIENKLSKTKFMDMVKSML